MSLNMKTGPLESDIGTEMILPNQKLHQKPCFFTTVYYIYIEVYPDVWCLNLHFIAVVRVFCCFVAGHVDDTVKWWSPTPIYSALCVGPYSLVGLHPRFGYLT